MKPCGWDDRFLPFLVLAAVPALIEGAAHIIGTRMEIMEARKQAAREAQEGEFWERLDAALARALENE